jgi:beta-lactamase superfamily II metal-dependent hydrolase
MHLEIFDVEHVACALLTADDGTRMMIDCGHNGSTDWHPGTYLLNSGISRLDLLAITNYDEDHVSGLPNLREKVEIGKLWRNKSVAPDDPVNLKS